ncbi:MAG: 7-carboxy-7-deazaguanine synthase QueE [Gammaproteobacteria bacterium]|nr:7-carboxy-7-deazaguanine synthase QueE [Gammaproteobacteria bacterium]
MNSEANLRITEIFHSLQGEAKTVGVPTVFVRLTGCPLRCQYCDTAYAFEGGEIITLEAIVEKVKSYNCGYVTVTGGEPLAQPNCALLLTRLCDNGLHVSIETSGAMPIQTLDDRVSIVLDLKTPGSLECDRNQYENVSCLREKDQVKFVICDRNDYEWSKAKVDQFDLRSRVGEVLFSPSYEQLEGAELAQWVLDDKIDVRVQLQLHKILWGDGPGR